MVAEVHASGKVPACGNASCELPLPQPESTGINKHRKARNKANGETRESPGLPRFFVTKTVLSFIVLRPPLICLARAHKSSGHTSRVAPTAQLTPARESVLESRQTTTVCLRRSYTSGTDGVYAGVPKIPEKSRKCTILVPLRVRPIYA